MYSANFVCWLSINLVLHISISRKIHCRCSQNVKKCLCFVGFAVKIKICKKRLSFIFVNVLTNVNLENEKNMTAVCIQTWIASGAIIASIINVNDATGILMTVLV